MPITDIAHYYTISVGQDEEKSYVPKPFDYFELLQLSRDFDVDEVQLNIRKLFLAFHPVHCPDHKELRDEVFKKISSAWSILKDSAKRADYLRSLDGLPLDANFVPFTPPSTEEAERYYSECMEAFMELNEADDCDVIYRQLYSSVTQSTARYSPPTDRERTLYSFLKQKASTGNDFYRLVSLQCLNPFDFGQPAGNFLQIATNTGHLQAISMRIDYVFRGTYTHFKEQIIWALDCIKYLEEVVIPKLSVVLEQPQATPANLKVQTSMRQYLVERLEEVRQRVSLPIVIPKKGTEDYNNLIVRLNAIMETHYNSDECEDLPVPDSVEVLALRHESGYPSQALALNVLDRRPSPPVEETEPDIEEFVPAPPEQSGGVLEVNPGIKIDSGSNEDPLRKVKEGLQAYLNKVKNTYNLKFDHGFRFFRESQAENRHANYLLAQSLLEKLNEGTAIEVVFSTKKTIKEQRLALMHGKKFRDHGINSKDLNEVISMAMDMVKAARKNAGADEVPARTFVP